MFFNVRMNRRFQIQGQVKVTVIDCISLNIRHPIKFLALTCSMIEYITLINNFCLPFVIGRFFEHEMFHDTRFDDLFLSVIINTFSHIA